MPNPALECQTDGIVGTTTQCTTPSLERKSLSPKPPQAVSAYNTSRNNSFDVVLIASCQWVEFPLVLNLRRQGYTTPHI